MKFAGRAYVFRVGKSFLFLAAQGVDVSATGNDDMPCRQMSRGKEPIGRVHNHDNVTRLTGHQSRVPRRCAFAAINSGT
ncbi:hypothetical protein BKA83DRAFT_4180137 [Pisolithus microcarpus]|nr:hypothetical protein BKA83DRAFT_4180137 [Pisolithus microcarpus]